MGSVFSVTGMLAFAFWPSAYMTLTVSALPLRSPAGGSRKRSAHDSVPARRSTSGQSCESVVSRRQFVGPLSVWLLMVTCLIGVFLKLERVT